MRIVGSYRRVAPSVIAAILVSYCLLLSACSPEAQQTQPPSPTASSTPSAAGEGCIGDIEYPELPVSDVNASLPLDGIEPDFTRAELLVRRSSGECKTANAIPSSESACAVLTGPSESNINVMLGRNSDDVLADQFAAGAVSAISETVTGRARDGEFTYRMSAWDFGDEGTAKSAPVLSALATCPSLQSQGIAGYEVLVISDGDEPSAVLFRGEQFVFLIESIRRVGVDGSEARLSTTASGLLPFSAVATIVEWWVDVAPRALEDGTAV